MKDIAWMDWYWKEVLSDYTKAWYKCSVSLRYKFKAQSRKISLLWCFLSHHVWMILWFIYSLKSQLELYNEMNNCDIWKNRFACTNDDFFLEMGYPTLRVVLTRALKKGAKQPLHLHQGAAYFFKENCSLSIHGQLETNMGLDTAPFLW